MSRRFGHTSDAPRQKCLRRNCDKWEFAKGLCKPCAAEGGVINHLSEVDWTVYKNKPPETSGLVVVATLDQPHYLELTEGDYVDVLEWQRDKKLAICRTGDQKVGFYADSALKSEEDVFAEFMQHEDAALIEEIEQKEAAERAAEEAFDRNLREQMKAKAEQDRLARQQEAEQRRLDAERALEELEQRKAWEAEQARLAAEEKQRARREKADRDAKAAKVRAIEASAVRQQSEAQNRARLQQKEAEAKAWESAEAARKDKEYLDSLPAWKREVVLRKRAQKDGS